jgi:hypothetical protein
MAMKLKKYFAGRKFSVLPSLDVEFICITQKKMMRGNLGILKIDTNRGRRLDC